MQMTRITVCVNTRLLWVYYPGAAGLGCNKKGWISSPFFPSVQKSGGGSRKPLFWQLLLQEVDVIDVGEHVSGPGFHSDKSSLHCCSWIPGVGRGDYWSSLPPPLDDGYSGNSRHALVCAHT